MRSIRSGRGLGDSIYLQSVVRHMVQDGAGMEVCSDWPDVFAPLGDRARVVPFRRNGVTFSAHYVTGKARDGTTQFQDCCLAAGIAERVELCLDWPEPHGELIDHIRAPGRPVLVVGLPRHPMGREDGYGLGLLPDPRMTQRIIDELRHVATVVQVGAGQPLHRFSGVDVDLSNRTTVRELIDVVAACDGVLGYCSFLLPLAESLDKPALFVWARQGLGSANEFIRTVTPRKLLHKSSSMWIMDDAADERFRDTVGEFCRLVAGR